MYKKLHVRLGYYAILTTSLDGHHEWFQYWLLSMVLSCYRLMVHISCCGFLVKWVASNCLFSGLGVRHPALRIPRSHFRSTLRYINLPLEAFVVINEPTDQAIPPRCLLLMTSLTAYRARSLLRAFGSLSVHDRPDYPIGKFACLDVCTSLCSPLTATEAGNSPSPPHRTHVIHITPIPRSRSLRIESIHPLMVVRFGISLHGMCILQPMLNLSETPASLLLLYS